jgi:Fe-S cluster biogenesis protein NfuA
MNQTEKNALLARVEEALESIRPHLQADGGNIEVLDLTPEGVVQVRWLGACQSCSMSAMTMKAGIEFTIKTKIPEITAVVAINSDQVV